MPQHREDPIVSTARREALVVALIFICAMSYSVLYCYWNGYHRPPESLSLVFGVPDWVFWGVVAPWMICLLLSFWFGSTFMHDAELGVGEETQHGDGSEAEDV
jgi:hypothetical protein